MASKNDDLIRVLNDMIQREHKSVFFRGLVATVTGNTATVIRSGQTAEEGPYATLASYAPVNGQEVLVVDTTGGGQVTGVIVGRILR